MLSFWKDFRFESPSLEGEFRRSLVQVHVTIFKLSVFWLVHATKFLISLVAYGVQPGVYLLYLLVPLLVLLVACGLAACRTRMAPHASAIMSALCLLGFVVQMVDLHYAIPEVKAKVTADYYAIAAGSSEVVLAAACGPVLRCGPRWHRVALLCSH